MPQQQRYHWQKPSDLPDRLELIDRVTSQPAAVITSISRRWRWQRKTSLLVHGVAPAEGEQSYLEEAKEAVLDGLPEADHLRRKKPR